MVGVMRLIRKSIIFCAVGILLNLAIHIYVRSQLVPAPVNLTYKIFDINIKEGSLSVQLDIEEANTNNLILDAGLPAEFQALEIHSVHDAVGKPMKYLYTVNKVESHEDVSYSASELAIPLKRRHKFVRITYQVRVGRENLPPNPAVKAGQTTPGYMSEDRGLFYGRNIFLVPRIQIGQIKIEINPLKKWNIVSTFQESENIGEFLLVAERPKQAIFDAVIRLGKFTEYTKQIDQTVVKIFVGEGCQPHESKIVDTAFSIFQSMSGLFGGTGDQYTFIFTPANQEGDNVWTASNSMGLGATLTMPPTETQWLEVAKNVFSKWEKYSANSLSYSQQDKWFLVLPPLIRSINRAS